MVFENLEKKPLDRIFRLLAEYLEDENPKKVNLGIGIYADKMGKPFVFPSVKRAFEMVDKDNFNYQPIGGMESFKRLTVEMIFGEGLAKNFAVQASCGGTQACRIFADLVNKASGKIKIHIGEPSWGNYKAIFQGLEIREFDHLDEDGGVNFKGYKRVVEGANVGDVLLIQGALAHNPTGRNLSKNQLLEILPILKEKKMILFMDMAYMGLGEGREKDLEYARICADELDDFAVAFSFSKNASLYEHRTGALLVKTREREVVESQMQQICRESISMAPGIGQEMMTNILIDLEMRQNWFSELEEVRMGVLERKNALVDLLGAEFEYLRECEGMFGMLRLAKDKIVSLREEFSVYLLENGRINFAGIKVSDLEYVAGCVKKVS